MLIKPLRPSSCTFRARVLLEFVGLSEQLFRRLEYRGFYPFCRLLARCARRNSCILQLRSDSFLQINIGDPYWLQFVPAYRHYERELSQVFELYSDKDVLFLDGGANIGYWSVLTTSGAFPRWHTIAVEASPMTFKQLVANCLLNHGRFQCINRALYDCTGLEVVIATVNNEHAGARVRRKALCDPNSLVLQERVLTLSIDDLMQPYEDKSSSITILKLDIEGQELNALRGAAKTLRRESVLVVYEDHGLDHECAATDYLLKKGMAVFHWPHHARLQRVRTVQDALAYKESPNSGFNFVACHSSTPIEQVFRDQL